VTTTLAGRGAVVTGGGRGIGAAIAAALLEAGARVVVAARTRNEIDAEKKLHTYLDLGPAGTLLRGDGHLIVVDNKYKAVLDVSPEGHVGVIAESRDDDHGDTVRPTLHLPQQPASILARHGEVRHHDVDIRHQRERRAGVRHRNDVRAGVTQDLLQDVATVVVVLDDEDAHAEERLYDLVRHHRTLWSLVRRARRSERGITAVDCPETGQAASIQVNLSLGRTTGCLPFSMLGVPAPEDSRAVPR